MNEGSPLSGTTLADPDLRAATGVSVVAIGRNGTLIGNPNPDEVLRAGDRLAVIGTPGQVSEADERFTRAHP